jgi:hypothetical protein
MNIATALRQLASGAITFDELKAQFEQATFKVRQPTQGDWGAVWQRADDLPDDYDVPEALVSAAYARRITVEQRDQLMEIYRRRVMAAAMSTAVDPATLDHQYLLRPVGSDGQIGPDEVFDTPQAALARIDGDEAVATADVWYYEKPGSEGKHVFVVTANGEMIVDEE